MKSRRLFSFLLSISLCFTAGAQFFSSGDDPAGLRWYSISSPDFKIIYPEGLDSLARAYGAALEKFRVPVSRSIGYEPDGLYKKPMPVILHAYASSNGMVTWAPRRMEFYTGPDANDPETMEWITELSVHESRHASQMQFGALKRYRVFNWLIGQMFTGAMSALYPGPAFLEGDAVVAETTLTDYGRGRNADFLEFYRASFAEGDYRNYYQWRWESQKRFTPDYYKVGYLLIGGTRAFFDAPLFSADYFGRFRHGFPFPANALNKTLKKDTGMRLKEIWPEISQKQQEIWAQDEESRGPFLPTRQLTSDTRRFTQYTDVTSTPGHLLAVRRSITSTPRLVSIDTLGRVDVIRPLHHSASNIQYSSALCKVFWNETIPDIRWTHKSTSRIITADPDGSHRKYLTTSGRLYNPMPSSDTRISVTEYPVEGGSAVMVLDGNDGTVLARLQAPDSLQVVETAWIGDEIYASAISPAGFGIYCVTSGFTGILAPAAAQIKQLGSSGTGIHFVSDRLGVNELYSLDTASGTVTQLTNNRFGATEFIFDNDSVTFAALKTTGRMLYRSESRPVGPVDYGAATGCYPLADKLSAQEADLAPSGASAAPASFSAPARYRKAAHLFRFHSWLPFYAEYDNVSNMSLETLETSTTLGATAFFQNDLGTAHGYIGYSASPSEGLFSEGESPRKWDHSGHAMLTYSGLFPVFELTASVGGRQALQYGVRTVLYDKYKELSITSRAHPQTSFSGSAKVYVPLNFSSGGWNRGVIPQVSWSVTNDLFNTTEVQCSPVSIYTQNGTARELLFQGYVPGRWAVLSRVCASLRGYTTMGIAESGIFPRWGIGAEVGYAARPGLASLFKSNFYSNVYGYLPGLVDTHGIRLSAKTQIQNGGIVPAGYIYVVPQGFSDINSSVQNFTEHSYPVQTLFCAEYALPFACVDWSGLGRFAYLRNFELRGMFDFGLYGGGSAGTGTLSSAGVSIAARLSNFLYVPYDTRIGVSFFHNSGSLTEALSDKVNLKKNTISFIFSVDM